MRIFRSIVAAFAMVQSALVYAGEPISLSRAEKWRANFEADSCNLIGTFGQGDQRVYIQLIRYRPSDSFALHLIGSIFRSDETRSPIRLAFGPGAELQRVEVMNGRLANLPMAIVTYWRLDNQLAVSGDHPSPPVTPEQEAAVRTLDLRIRGRDYRLELGPMQATMRIMRECMNDLLKTWGFDPQEQAQLTRQATPLTSPATWLLSGDYPPGALSRGESGIVDFRLDVDEAGNPTACHILAATRPKGFEHLSCQLLMRRARFQHAINREGKPVRSFYISKIRWRFFG